MSSPSDLQQPQVDQRHLRRQRLVQSLFAQTFKESQLTNSPTLSSNHLPFDESSKEDVKAILQNLAEIDAKLQQFAPERPLANINQVDLAILRAIYWESITKDTPFKVLIDEAVELAKELGSDSSSRFVNGVLGKLLVEEEKVA